MIKRLVLATILVSAGCLRAEDTPAPSVREKNRAAAGNAYQENLEKYKGNADMLVLPGLVADRKEKRVVVQAETTALHEGEIAEFALIGENSGHDYEALALSFAKPSAVHKALEFIGMQAGKPCSEPKQQFWPKGERVLMSFARGAGAPIRVEKLVDDGRTGAALPESGLVFTGSMTINSADPAGAKAYAADAQGPNAIASNYNEPQTVLDVPRHSPQAVVYQHLRASRNLTFPTNSLIQVIIEPEHKDGTKRVVDLRLEVSPRPETAGAAVSDLAFSLKAGDKAVTREPTLKSVLEEVSALVAKGHDPFVSLQLDGRLGVKAIRDLCVVLMSIDTEKGLRMEPPLSGHLYYKAFAPDPAFLDRESRIAQPWELDLSVRDAKVGGVLTQIEQIWTDGVARPELKATDYTVATPEALKEALAKYGPGLPVILVKAPPPLSHEQLMTFLTPSLKTHPTVHVFVKE